MEYLKPINLFDARAYRPERGAVHDAICDLFAACGLRAVPPVTDYGCWRHPQYIDKRGYMVPYLSVPWYVAQAREGARRRVNAQSLMAAFRREPWRRKELLGDHYDLLLVDDPLFEPAEEEHFGLLSTPGYAVNGIAAVLSTADIEPLDRVTYSLLKTLAMREMAHAFGAPGLRTAALRMTPRIACTDRCLMGPCIEMPQDLERLTEIRLAGPPLCERCLAALRRNLADDAP
ncbi:MAG: hypothetical protein ACOC8A_00815 [bacterium]